MLPKFALFSYTYVKKSIPKSRVFTVLYINFNSIFNYLINKNNVCFLLSVVIFSDDFIIVVAMGTTKTIRAKHNYVSRATCSPVNGLSVTNSSVSVS